MHLAHAEKRRRIAAFGGTVSVSTESEQSAGQGYPPTWQLRKHDIPVSLSMGCGTWGRNNFSDNMNVRHYMNVTRVAFPIAEKVPPSMPLNVFPTTAGSLPKRRTHNR